MIDGTFLNTTHNEINWEPLGVKPSLRMPSEVNVEKQPHKYKKNREQWERTPGGLVSVVTKGWKHYLSQLSTVRLPLVNEFFGGVFFFSKRRLSNLEIRFKFKKKKKKKKKKIKKKNKNNKKNKKKKKKKTKFKKKKKQKKKKK